MFASPIIGNSLNRQDSEMQQAIKQTYDELSGAGTTDLKTMEVMIIVAYKD